MYKWLRMAALALPLAGGVASAQGSGSSGSAGAPSGVKPMNEPGTIDTRTPTQKRAGQIDATPALPGDATKPIGTPETAPMSDRAGLPESATHDDTSAADQGKSQPQQRRFRRSNETDADHPRSSDWPGVLNGNKNSNSNQAPAEVPKEQGNSDK
jgi:hypothetical protein